MGADTGPPDMRSPDAPADTGPADTGPSLRIALLTYRGHPWVGGQGIYVRHLARELSALGHSVEVFSGPPYPHLDEGIKLTELPSLDLYRMPDPFRVPKVAGVPLADRRARVGHHLHGLIRRAAHVQPAGLPVAPQPARGF